MTDPTSARFCPSCGATASGRFCSSCGATLDATACSACSADIAPGSSFCPRCGTPVGARTARPVSAEPAPRGIAASLPWVVAAIALLAMIGLVAAQRIADARSGQAPLQPVAGRAPDISQFTPRQAANVLYERVMRLQGEGKSDSVAFFATMAMQAFGMLDSLDADARYDLGRIAEIAGAYPVARAQADTILQRQPSHLLGLVLAARVAAATGDSRARREFERRLLEAEPAESGKRLPEYEAHAPEIQQALAEARRRG